MARKCSIPKCRSNYNGSVHIPTFKFPVDEAMRQKWIKSINKKNFNISKHSCVCVKHFEEIFLIRFDRFVSHTGQCMTYKRKILKLTDGAYPTLFGSAVLGHYEPPSSNITQELPGSDNQDLPVKEKLFKCLKCKYNSLDASQIALHVKTHLDHEEIVCDVCNYVPMDALQMERHMETHLTKIEIKCEIDQEMMQIDEQKELPHSDYFKCDYCEYVSNDELQMEEHVQRHTGQVKTAHRSLVKEEVISDEYIIQDNIFRCRFCKYEALDEHQVINHEAMHRSQIEFKCNYCEFTSSLVTQIKSHEEFHTQHLHYCEQCNFRTESSYQLALHVKLHTGVMDIKCSECEYTAATMQQINRHRKAHNAIVYSCEQCSFKSYFKFSFDNHKKIHLKIKVQCDFCNFETYDKAALEMHKTFFHSEQKHSITSGKKYSESVMKLFQCERCDFCTTNQPIFDKHMLKHGEKVELKEHNVGDFKTCDKDAHNRTNKTCDDCDYCTLDNVNFEVHTKDHNIERSCKLLKPCSVRLKNIF